AEVALVHGAQVQKRFKHAELALGQVGLGHGVAQPGVDRVGSADQFDQRVQGPNLLLVALVASPHNYLQLEILYIELDPDAGCGSSPANKYRLSSELRKEQPLAIRGQTDRKRLRRRMDLFTSPALPGPRPGGRSARGTDCSSHSSARSCDRTSRCP